MSCRFSMLFQHLYGTPKRLTKASHSPIYTNIHTPLGGSCHVRCCHDPLGAIRVEKNFVLASISLLRTLESTLSWCILRGNKRKIHIYWWLWSCLIHVFLPGGPISPGSPGNPNPSWPRSPFGPLYPEDRGDTLAENKRRPGEAQPFS